MIQFVSEVKLVSSAIPRKLLKTINKTLKTNKRSTREGKDVAIFTISRHAYTFMIIVLGLGK